MEISKFLIQVLQALFIMNIDFFFPPLSRDFSKCILNILNIKLGSCYGLKFDCYSCSYFNIEIF